MEELTRARKVVTILGLLGGIGVLGMLLLVRFVEVPAAPTAPRVARTPGRLDALPRPVESLPPSSAALRALLAERYRLRPDRRFLLAVGELRRLHGAPAVAATARFEDGRWKVMHGERVVGALPEHADFTDAVALLTSWEDALQRERAMPPMTAGAVPPEASGWVALAPERPAWAALERVEQEWAAGRRSNELLAAAARALVALAFQTPDAVDGADLLAARALAALVIARRAGAPVPAAESLLADAMGYTAAARETARALAEDDPVRAFVLRDHDRLRAAASAEGAGGDAGYLWYRAVVAREDAAATDAWVGERYARIPETVAVGGFGKGAIPSGDLARHRAASEGMPARMLYALEREAGVEAPVPLQNAGEILPRVEALARRRTVRGPFLDGALLVARDGAVIETALLGRVNLYLHTLGLPASAAEFLNVLAPTCPDSRSAFLNWITHLVHVEAGTLQPEALLTDLTSDAPLSGAQLTATAARLFESLHGGDARHELAFQKLSTRLDARPAHRATLAWYARTIALDPVLTESLCEAQLRVSPDASPSTTVACAMLRRDTDAVQRVVRREDLPPRLRVHALDLLGDETRAPDELVEAEWRRLLDALPDSWPVRARYCSWLKARRRDADIVAVTTAWLRAHRDDPGLDRAVASARLSEAQLRLGDANAAWRTVQPVLESWQGNAMAQGARALVAMGRGEEAERLARATLERYPGAPQVALVAEVLWRRELLAQAATVLMRSGARLRNHDWGAEVGESFARVYGAEAPVRARQAVDAMLQQGVTPDLIVAMVRRMDRAGHPEVALAMHEPLNVGGVEQLDYLVERYELVREVRGAEAALAWIQAQVPPQQRGPLSVPAYERGADELMWSVVAPPPGDASNSDYVWLLRAATSLRHGPNDARREELRRHYADARGTDYHTMGRYLLGVVELPAVLALGRTDDRRCEVAYFVALKAHCEGHTAEASDWYRLTTLVGNRREGEYRWARAVMNEWSSRTESLDRIAQNPWPYQARRGLAPPAPAAQPATASAPSPEPEREARAPRRRHRRRHGGDRR